MGVNLQESYAEQAGRVVSKVIELPAIPSAQVCAVLQAREFIEDRYYRSQEKGYNVGDLYTLQHWTDSGHAARFREAFESNLVEIMESCASHCGDVCKVFDLRRLLGRRNGMCEEDLAACPMPTSEMHMLIEKRPL